VNVAFAVIIFQLSVKCRRIVDVRKVIGDCGISSNYFSILCEMLTDLSPSVWTSVIVQCTSKIIFVLSIYLPTNT